MAKSNVEYFIIVRNDVIISYERDTLEGVLETLGDFKAQWPNREYQLFKEIKVESNG